LGEVRCHDLSQYVIEGIIGRMSSRRTGHLLLALPLILRHSERGESAIQIGHDKHKITQQRDNGSEKRNQGMMEAKKGWGLLKGQQPRSMVN
jgi:hypothetical protein